MGTAPAYVCRKQNGPTKGGGAHQGGATKARWTKTSPEYVRRIHTSRLEWVSDKEANPIIGLVDMEAVLGTWGNRSNDPWQDVAPWPIDA
jgi:hypothetical protein